jgi:hypothetical protein
VAWQNFVHEKFQSKHSQADARQRHLALDLGEQAGWVDVATVTELTTRLAKAYGSKTVKTAQRDLNVLVKMGLVAKEGRTFRARREVILAFLPLRKRV